jgi:DNA-binding winged helix-turn-helix (wHTH) protein
VIDYSRFDHRADEIRFAADFGVQLYRRKQRKPGALHLFLDEADMFVPQKLPKNAKAMLDAYDAIVRRGGVYGLGITLISQRPALVNTDVRTQCETLIALQTTAPLDQDPIFDWVSRNGTDEQLRQIKRGLASLKVGQAWYFSPNSDVFQQIQIRTRETFNSSATPKPGAKSIEPKVFASIDIQALGEEISATVERSKQEDPDYLRRQIEHLRRELAQKPAAPARVEPQIERVEVPVITADQIQDLEARVQDVGRVIQEFREIRLEIEKIFNGKIDALNTAALSLSGAIDAFRKAPKPAAVTAVMPARAAVPVRPAPKPERKVDPAQASVEGITGPQQRVIDAIAWMESIGLSKPKRSIVAFLAGYSMSSSSFTNALGANRGAGLNTYPDSDSVDLTDAGRALANPQSAPITTQELHNVIFARLPTPQARVLRPLIDHYPDPVQREELADQAGYSVNSSSFTNALGALRTMGLIDYPSSADAVALPVLFLEG